MVAVVAQAADLAAAPGSDNEEFSRFNDI